MSVLIKGMSIPDHCIRCPFMVGRDNDDCILLTEEENLTFVSFKELKEHCPLVEVPTYHGDLIDAEEQMQLMQACEYDTYDDYNRAFDMLNNAPTIIPAERSN